MIDGAFLVVTGIAVGAVAISLYQMYLAGGKNAILTPEARQILYEAASFIISLSEVKDDNERVLDLAVKEAERRIKGSNLSDIDKEFLSEKNIRLFLQPIVEFLRDKQVTALQKKS